MRRFMLIFILVFAGALSLMAQEIKPDPSAKGTVKLSSAAVVSSSSVARVSSQRVPWFRIYDGYGTRPAHITTHVNGQAVWATTSYTRVGKTVVRTDVAIVCTRCGRSQGQGHTIVAMVAGCQVIEGCPQCIIETWSWTGKER